MMGGVGAIVPFCRKKSRKAAGRKEMIATGIDIVSIERIERALQRFGENFIARLLTEEEIRSLSMKPTSIAGYWAAKEAVSKALGCGIGAELAFHDIYISKDRRGSPSFRLSQERKKYFRLTESSLSISHDGGFAVAAVILVSK
jgi:holo-[acyl-carrier protein] synthase